MSDLPVPDYTPVAVGRRFPRCAEHGFHVRVVKACPEGAGGWGMWCPGPVGTRRPHIMPVRERAPEQQARFPACRLCGAVPRAVRPNLREKLLVSITFVDCGHTMGVPWQVALGY